MASVPWRSEAAEKALTGQRLEATVIDRVAEAATEGAEPLEQNAYKAPLLRGLMQERLAVLAG